MCYNECDELLHLLDALAVGNEGCVSRRISHGNPLVKQWESAIHTHSAIRQCLTTSLSVDTLL